MIPPPESDDYLFEALCGEQFANGQHRTVHHVHGHPQLVMKVDCNTTFANWNEYLVSSALSGRAEPVAELMGRAPSISATGKYLLMERLNDLDSSLAGVSYPVWLTDIKRSAFGTTPSGTVRVRDYGSLKLADVLAEYVPGPDREPRQRIVPDGLDKDYAALQGRQIGIEAGRTIHKVEGHPDHVMKICERSHRSNRIELLIFAALDDMHAPELERFGVLECSRSGKHLIMERLQDLPADFRDRRPAFPWWLEQQSDHCLGTSSAGDAKIRTYDRLKLGDVLVRAHLRTFS
jgi:hypothetical protein